MTVKRMDNVLIVVDDLEAAGRSLSELGPLARGGDDVRRRLWSGN